MSIRIEKLPGVAYVAFPDMVNLLTSELQERLSYTPPCKTMYGDILYYPDRTAQDTVPYWCRTALLAPMLIHFGSIGEAASALKNIQRNWAPDMHTLFRRGALIQDKLPYINLKPRKFPLQIPHSDVGLYTLIDENTLFASSVTSNCIPGGTIQFIEDHENPPSRAYLKIQESLALAVHYFDIPYPSETDKCFEAGACPGGWTWVLTQLGCSVFAVDRAELAPSLMHHPKVSFQAHDAFTLKPQDIGPFDWVFSDVICYPERLYSWVQMWLDSGYTKNMICTIKMQGAIDWSIVQKFADIPNSKVVHLNYNKHELTWIHCQK